MREIPLASGGVTIVDDEDYALAMTKRWRLCGGYAQASDRGRASRHDHIRLHRLLLDAPPHLQVDHINGDRLDNRRANLRLCTCAENGRAHRRRKGRSRFRGVAWNADVQKWQGTISVDGRRVYIGLFADEEACARAYDAMARKHYGAFASPNFPEAVHGTE